MPYKKQIFKNRKMMTIEEQVNEGIKNAMKAREKVRL